MERKSFYLNNMNEDISTMTSYLAKGRRVRDLVVPLDEPDNFRAEEIFVNTGNYHIRDASLRVCSYSQRKSGPLFRMTFDFTAQSKRQILAAKSLLEKEVGVKLK